MTFREDQHPRGGDQKNPGRFSSGGGPKKPSKAPVALRAASSSGITSEQIAQRLAAHGLSPEDVPHLVGAPDDAKIRVSVFPKDQSIAVYINSDVVGGGRRIFKDSAGDLMIENQFLEVDEKHRGNGIGLQIFSAQVENAAQAGVSKIVTYGIRDDSEKGIGYYVWPLFGYDAEIPPAMKAPAKRLSELFAMPGGREWWKKNGVSLHMEFDLSENSTSRKRLAQYMAEKQKSAANVVWEDFTADEIARMEALWDRAHKKDFRRIVYKSDFKTAQGLGSALGSEGGFLVKPTVTVVCPKCKKPVKDGGCTWCGWQVRKDGKFDPSKHPRASDGRFGTQAGQHPAHAAMGKLRDTRKAETYKAAFDAVHVKLNKTAQARVAKHVDEFVFHAAASDLTDMLKEVGDIPKDFSKTIAGCYASMPSAERQKGDLPNTLHLNGADEAIVWAQDPSMKGEDFLQHLYAHELTHAVDGPDHEISKSSEWQTAWKEEIVSKTFISNYAMKNPVEGLAEFGRMVWAYMNDFAAAKRQFPKCAAVFEKWGLVGETKAFDPAKHPREPKGTEGGGQFTSKPTVGVGSRVSAPGVSGTVERLSRDGFATVRKPDGSKVEWPADVLEVEEEKKLEPLKSLREVVRDTIQRDGGIDLGALWAHEKARGTTPEKFREQVLAIRAENRENWKFVEVSDNRDFTEEEHAVLPHAVTDPPHTFGYLVSMRQEQKPSVFRSSTGNKPKRKPDQELAKDFDPAKHPRGQPENAGQFGPGGGGKKPASPKREGGLLGHAQYLLNNGAPESGTEKFLAELAKTGWKDDLLMVADRVGANYPKGGASPERLLESIREALEGHRVAHALAKMDEGQRKEAQSAAAKIFELFHETEEQVMEHAAVLVDATIPEPVQQVAITSYKAAFITYRAGQAAAAEFARRKGGEEWASTVGKTLVVADLIGSKLGLTIGAFVGGPIGAFLGYVLPVGSSAFLIAAGIRDPKGIWPAAKEAVKAAMTLKAEAPQKEVVAGLMEGLKKTDDPDFFIAAFLAAYEATGDKDKALEIAGRVKRPD